ncbi:YihY/virulence factor BrkB family protein [Bacillus piscicola]|uniref:YihY/virulence factor BrkB family protein n=1 Tax=Bacillus piscicola TaxID=1632684 RepID=UPI001F08C2DF|nr:YihY/virulence factor BrkB family protein [Bacillus piscicola]
MATLKFYIKEIMTEFKKDNVTLLAAAQAYYYLLSIIPLLVVMFAIVPYLHIKPSDAVAFIHNNLPSEIASILEENIVSLVNTPQGGLLTIGIIGALWTASNGINAFIKAANDAYEIDETRSFIMVRLLALGLTLGLIASLAVAMLLPVFGNVLLNAAESIFNLAEPLLTVMQVLRWVISIVVLTGLLLLLYHLAPNKKIPFTHILPGALTASILWQLISLGFSFYVSNFGSYSATYGSLGGIIILMIWFFLTGLILMVGAEINVVYHRTHDEHDSYSQAKAKPVHS